MCTYASCRVKRKSFYRESELQIFSLISGGHIGAPKRYTNMASPYKALQRCVERFGNSCQKLLATKTLDLDNLFMYQSFIKFNFLGFFHWKIFNLLFCCVTVKTIYRQGQIIDKIQAIPLHRLARSLPLDQLSRGQNQKRLVPRSLLRNPTKTALARQDRGNDRSAIFNYLLGTK